MTENNISIPASAKPIGKATFAMLDTGFDEIEAIAPVDVMRRAGMAMFTVSMTENRLVKGATGNYIVADMELSELDPNQIDWLVFPGADNGRENHHKDSRTILEADEFVKSHFTRKQIVTMGRAVEDHRASNQKKPRNSYGLLVAKADRFIEAETIIRRTIQYGLANYPKLDKAGHYQRTIEHLNEKYGPNGYLKVWIPWSDNARNLKKLHVQLSDKRKLEEIFNRIFDEENE